MKFLIKDFFSTANLVTLTEEILNVELRFLCSDICRYRSTKQSIFYEHQNTSRHNDISTNQIA